MEAQWLASTSVLQPFLVKAEMMQPAPVHPEVPVADQEVQLPTLLVPAAKAVHITNNWRQTSTYLPNQQMASFPVSCGQLQECLILILINFYSA